MGLRELIPLMVIPRSLPKKNDLNHAGTCSGVQIARDISKELRMRGSENQAVLQGLF